MPVKPSADARKITIETSLPPSAGFIGDSDRLRQVVWNILSKAVSERVESWRDIYHPAPAAA